MKKPAFTLAAKCAPEPALLKAIAAAGINAVEIYTDDRILADAAAVARTCRAFDLRYAVHAPVFAYDPPGLITICKALDAEVCVLHTNYFEDEWKAIARAFSKIKTRPCVENSATVLEPFRYMRRYGFGLCLDLEHLELEIHGIYEEEVLRAIAMASHIHATGFARGSAFWHTHLHHNPRHARYLLDLLATAGYRGLVVSEARIQQQTHAEFKRLKTFFTRWQRSHGHR
jgi:sugar phosphate isomerase/epimerase